MRNFKLSVVYAMSLFFIFSVALQLQAQPSQNRSTITGFVFDPQRNAVTQIPVELLNEVNSVVSRTRTDNSGRFFFPGLSQGRFTIKVMPLGTNFEEQTQEVEISGIGAFGRSVADNVQKDFYLRLRRDNRSEGSLTGTVFAQAIPEEAQKAFDKAISDIESNRIDDGIKGLQTSIGIFPNYFLALERLGLIYIAQQKYENAKDALTKATKINPRSFNSWYGLSYASYYLKQSSLAIEYAQKAVSINSNSVEALLFLGISQRQDKKYEDAEKSLKQAEKIAKGTSPDVHWHLALLYAHNLKRYKEAADELELYLKISPNISNKESIEKLIKQFRANAVSK